MLAAPFALNGAMAAAKWAAAKNWSTPQKRALLAVLSLVGVIAGNLLAGTPVQPDSLTFDFQALFESLAAFLAAHGSYHLFWRK